MKTLSAWLCALGMALAYLSSRLWWFIEETHGASAIRNALSRVRAALRHDETMQSVIGHRSSVIGHLLQQIEQTYAWLEVAFVATAVVALALLLSSWTLFWRSLQVIENRKAANH